MRTRPGSHPADDWSVRGPFSAVRAVFLVGFMGAGKSSVGRELAQQLRWPFEDLDDRIQTREQRTIAQIFQESGEAEFRRVEHAALRDLLAENNPARVVALGGGAFVQTDNAALLEQAEVATVFLDAPVEELFRRCQQEPLERPLRRDQEQFRRLYEIRRPYYAAATLRVETSGKPVAMIAAEVIQALRLQ